MENTQLDQQPKCDRQNAFDLAEIPLVDDHCEAGATSHLPVASQDHLPTQG
jgi:hypothetical protein